MIKGGDDYLTVALEDKIKKLMEKGYLPRTAKIIQLSEMSNEIFSAYMDLFVEQILKMYRREQIILVYCIIDKQLNIAGLPSRFVIY